VRIDTTQLLQNLGNTNPLRGVDGDVVPLPDETTTAYQLRAMIDLSFRKAAVEALLVMIDDESGEKKLKKFILAERIQIEDIVTLTNDDVKLLQESCNKHSITLVLGRMIEILDPVEYKKVSAVAK